MGQPALSIQRLCLLIQAARRFWLSESAPSLNRAESLACFYLWLGLPRSVYCVRFLSWASRARGPQSHQRTGSWAVPDDAPKQDRRCADVKPVSEVRHGVPCSPQHRGGPLPRRFTPTTTELAGHGLWGGGGLKVWHMRLSGPGPYIPSGLDSIGHVGNWKPYSPSYVLQKLTSPKPFSRCIALCCSRQ